MATTKTVKINVDKKARIEYPRATIAANIVPAMRTPDASFPLRVSVLKTETSEDGALALVPDKDGHPTVVKTILERIKPDGKETFCGLKSPYHSTWAYSLAHAVVVFVQGGNVKGRVYASTFAHNYARPELDMTKLFEHSGFQLLVEMPASKSMPATMGKKTSAWIVPIAALSQYAITLANMTAMADSMTEQRAAEVETDAGEPEVIEFEL